MDDFNTNMPTEQEQQTQESAINVFKDAVAITDKAGNDARINAYADSINVKDGPAY